MGIRKLQFDRQQLFDFTYRIAVKNMGFASNLKKQLEVEIFPVSGDSAFDIADGIACVLNEYQGNMFDDLWIYVEMMLEYNILTYHDEADFLFQMERMYDFAPFERKDNRNGKNKQRQKWRDDALYKYLWKSFEFELSHAYEVEMEEKSQSVLEVMDFDGGLIGIEDTIDDYWEDEYHFIEMLNHYVWKWEKQIRLNKAYPRETCFIENTED